TVSILPVPAGFVDVAGRAINNADQVAGSYDDAKGLHGFIETRGNFLRFDVPGGLDTAALAINDSGFVVGNYMVATTAKTLVGHGFFMSRGRFTHIDFPGGTDTQPTVLNNAGLIAGTYVNPA